VARKKTPTVRVNVKKQLSDRLREVRQDLFGEHGGPELARRLNLPARTWYNYETGVTVPAEVLLTFIEQTGTNPIWLLTGNGARYRRAMEDQVLDDLTPEQLIRRGLEKLEERPHEVVLVRPDNLPGENSSDFVAVGLTTLSAMSENSSSPEVQGHILAYRQWIPHPRETVAVRLDDQAMHPILPHGSVVAIDRAVRDPQALQGRMVAARPEGVPIIRWLEVTGRHMILRPNLPSREHPSIPVDLDHAEAERAIIGQVVWSWSRFNA
jgi:SOS-response transcriptional repressor LexA